MSDLVFYGDHEDIVPGQGRLKRVVPAERAEKAEAVIQRVRDRAEGPIPAVHGDWMGGYAAAMRDIRQALEGDSDD